VSDDVLKAIKALGADLRGEMREGFARIEVRFAEVSAQAGGRPIGMANV
jgi:hypothetical protein